jgi:hypothetical protein
MKTGFLYFLPGKSAGDKLDLDALGLSHARAPGEPTKAPVTKGPDDGPGLLLVFAGDHAPRYVAAEQTWRKSPGGGHWVGVFNAHKPGPEDLAREQVIGGEPIRMLDGADWVIPICQSPVRGRPTVPRQLDLDDQGQWVRRVLPKYARVCEDAERVFHHWLGENWVADVPPVSLSEDEGWRIAADALAVNYRVSPLEIAMLGIWSDAIATRVLFALADISEILRQSEAERAKRPTSPADGSPTSSGEQVAPPPAGNGPT